jgi:hypothetical protein
MDWSDPKAARGILGANVSGFARHSVEQRALAELSDLDQPHISDIGARLINLALDNVQASAVALGVEPSDLRRPPR